MIDDVLQLIEDEAAAGLSALAAELSKLRSGGCDVSKIGDRIHELARTLSDYRNIAGKDIDGIRLTRMLVENEHDR